MKFLEEFLYLSFCDIGLRSICCDKAINYISELSYIFATELGLTVLFCKTFLELIILKELCYY